MVESAAVVLRSCHYYLSKSLNPRLAISHIPPGGISSLSDRQRLAGAEMGTLVQERHEGLLEKFAPKYPPVSNPPSPKYPTTISCREISEEQARLMWTTVSERLESRGGPALVEAEVKDVGDQNRRAFSETHLRVLDDIVAGQTSCIFQPKWYVSSAYPRLGYRG